MKQNDWPKMENSGCFIKMAEQTAKMTQSHEDVGVRGWSARSGRGLDREARVNAGCARVNTGRA
jgi:hypothetical protein